VVLDPAILSALFNGVALVLGGLGLTAVQRSKRAAVSRAQYRRLQREHLAALGHIWSLEQGYAARGIPIPARPEILERTEDDSSDGPGPDPAPAPSPAGG
jgi:hypothetical protein